MTTWHNPQRNAIENLLWYLIVYIRVKTDMWHGFTKTECKAMKTNKKHNIFVFKFREKNNNKTGTTYSHYKYNML